MHKQHHPPQAFAQLGISVPLLHALERIQFVKPSEIQEQMIPLILEGRDVLGQARTGTGKTAAFGLPILQMIRKDQGLQALMLVPTRELAVQVTGELRRLGEGTDLHIVPLYGGQRIREQIHQLGRKPHVVVGTPGRIMDLLQRRVLLFDQIQYVVLDEVDRMLDIGFRDDIRKILSQVRTEHQTVFVSATMTDDIKQLAQRYTNNPLEVNVSQDELTVEQVRQTFITVDPWDKFEALRLLLGQEDSTLTIVFCNTKAAARRLAKRLHAVNIDAKEIHGDLVQKKREKVMDRFRRHKVPVLVATDLASRGIDVQGISHIVNYDLPDDPHVYVHRIGRTARMGSFGKAISFATREQGKQLTEIEQLINKQIEQDSIEGFQPRPPREQEHLKEPLEHAVEMVSSYSGREERTQEASPSPEESTAPEKPKRLGGKFKPARRRR